MRAIRDLDKSTAIGELQKLLQQAQGEENETILLSSEFLCRQFGRQRQRDLLYSCFSEFGIQNITLVYVFRNIFDHAVSAYCSRCGRNPMPPFSDWISEKLPSSPNFRLGINCYEAWTDLRLLLEATQEEKFKFKFLPYTRNMEGQWEGFLGAPIKLPEVRMANVSLSPSEAEILRRLRNVYGENLDSLYQSFKNIEASRKPDDSPRRLHYNSIISDELKKHAKLIDEAEKVFGFRISQQPENVSQDTSDSVTLNELQMDALMESFEQMLKTSITSRKALIGRVLPAPLRSIARRAYYSLARSK